MTRAAALRLAISLLGAGAFAITGARAFGLWGFTFIVLAYLVGLMTFPLERPRQALGVCMRCGRRCPVCRVVAR